MQKRIKKSLENKKETKFKSIKANLRSLNKKVMQATVKREDWTRRNCQQNYIGEDDTTGELVVLHFDVEQNRRNEAHERSSSAPNNLNQDHNLRHE